MTSDPNVAVPKSSFRPTITAQISLGNLVTIVGGIAAIAAGWSNLDSRVMANTDATSQNAAAMQNVRAEVVQANTRLRNTELAVTRQDERTSSILTGIARIEGQLQRLDQRLNGRK